MQQLPAEAGGNNVDLGRLAVGTHAIWYESFFPFILVFYHPTVTQIPLLPVSFFMNPSGFVNTTTKVVVFIVG